MTRKQLAMVSMFLISSICIAETSFSQAIDAAQHLKEVASQSAKIVDRAETSLSITTATQDLIKKANESLASKTVTVRWKIADVRLDGDGAIVTLDSRGPDGFREAEVRYQKNDGKIWVTAQNNTIPMRLTLNDASKLRPTDYCIITGSAKWVPEKAFPKQNEQQWPIARLWNGSLAHFFVITDYKYVTGSKTTLTDQERVIPKTTIEAPADDEYRTWSDRRGKSTVIARLLNLQHGSVYLQRKKDDYVLVVKPSDLSDRDQEYVNREMKRRTEVASK